MTVPAALLLDLDDTLIDGAGVQTGTVAACVRLAPEFGVEQRALAAEVGAEFVRYWTANERDWILGRVDDQELTTGVWRRVLAAHDLDPAAAERMADVHLAALHTSHEPFPDAIPLLDAARDAGLALAIVTNGSRVAQRAKIALLGAEGSGANRFGAIVVSGEHGVAKPDAEIFRIALRELGVAPELAVHVGDNPVNDVAGAKAVGIRAILLDRSHSTEGAGCGAGPRRVAAPARLLSGSDAMSRAVTSSHAGNIA